MQEGEGSSAMFNTVTLASIERSNDDEIEEEHKLQAVSANNSGKKEGDEVLSIHVRLVAEREAAIT